jgi:uncharacterized membrane protein
MATQNHVENPMEYAVEKLGWTLSDIGHTLASWFRPRELDAAPAVRKITVADLTDALRLGAADLGAVRDDVLFIGIIYPVAGLVLARLAFSYDLLPLIFPLASGFALIGPVAAIGLYEISRRREHGDDVGWAAGFGVLRSPSMPAIIGLGLIELSLFAVWLAVAFQIYVSTLGPAPPGSVYGFVNAVLQTPAGWEMTAVGLGVGFLFAVLAFALSAVSFPLLLDRDVGLRAAIGTSMRAVAANPGIMALWGVIVAGLLVLGSIPLLAGLIVVVPLLGHASWHLYRKVVEPARGGRPKEVSA